jgi:hypothetical protein
MRPHDINDTNSFVSGWYSEDYKIYDDLIQLFKDGEDIHYQGRAGGKINLDYKRCTEMALRSNSEDSRALAYFHELSKVLDKYKEQYPFCSELVNSWTIFPTNNIQKYEPGEAYTVTHCEEGGKVVGRHLFFITYLNDVTDEGETEFLHQGIKVKPEKGLTIISPTAWTHAHRGIASLSQKKYIVTGWFVFNESEYVFN